ncbi:unnamed protein product [Ambrosiozyma monospora]|uniref:Unnamed protein product n=1 Tax=Ambrosiozyma monospora TaxID=43982 RepID=A0ACB5TW31_AMBMO|nr:unnamed protein product [Ambrosiozyma monospora]
MAFMAAYRPAVWFFFFLRQPVAAGTLMGTWLFWEADRNFNIGIRDAITDWRQGVLGFPTAETKYDQFKKIDEQKRGELLLKN